MTRVCGEKEARSAGFRSARLVRGSAPCAVIVLMWVATVPGLVAQQNERPRSEPRKVLSPAEAESSELASLSPETILSLLREEPGLLLITKRMLVRKAYEQGRLLDEDELTDSAVFDLIRQDARIRTLVTEEIVRRGYIRVRPTKEERQRKAEEEEIQRLRRLLRARELGLEAPAREPSEQPPEPAATERARTAQASGQEPGKPRKRDRWDWEEEDETLVPDTYEPVVPSQPQRIRPDELPALLAAGSSASEIPGGMSERLGDVPNPEKALRDEQAAARTESGKERATETASLGTTPSRERLRTPRSLTGRVREEQPFRRRPNPYADVPALYDLYSQVSPTQELRRFGEDVLHNRMGLEDDMPIDLPVGPEYVLGPGDGLNIDLWGSISERVRRVVDRQGQVALPEVGPVLVAGRSLGDVQQSIQAILRTQFQDVQADVSIGRLRTVRVYVVGEVEQPGPYDISSLSTALSAIVSAGGATPRGSLRRVRHYRGKELVQEVDLYDLILRGTRSDVKHLESGDTIMVPPVGGQITIEGMVRRPAIFEIRDETNLAEALELAGGVLPTGTLRRVEVERLEAHQRRTMLTLEIPETQGSDAVQKALEEFKIQDGDKIRIAPILPYSQQTVYLDGHVFHPGKYAYVEGMKISDLIKSYGDLLPEPSQRHAEIIRLKQPDFRPVVIAFNLTQAMAKGEGDLPLQPFDTVRIFGRYDFEDAPQVTVSGEVRDPGEHRTNGEIHLRDAVYLAGGLTPNAMLEEAQVFRKLPGGGMKVLSANLARALADDPRDNVLLQPMDRVIIHRDLTKLDPPSVYVQGEVAKPGRYPLGEGMTASELVRVAGGFKRGAYTEMADLTRRVRNDSSLTSERREIEIAKAMSGDASADVVLEDGDVLAIRQITGWKDRGAAITVRGEVVHPGTYGISSGERLSSILERAGGFRAEAYPQGAVLERVQVRELAEASRIELIRRMEAEQASMQNLPEAKDPNSPLSSFVQVWAQRLDELKNQPPVGRVVIRINGKIKRWKNTPADIEVRAGDVLTIPKTPSFVMIQGHVYNPTAIAYAPGKNAGWYLARAGGVTEIGNKKAVFVVRADGSVVGGGSSGWWKGDALGARLNPGDMVVVPEKLPAVRSSWKTVLEAAQLATTAGVILNAVTR